MHLKRKNKLFLIHIIAYLLFISCNEKRNIYLSKYIKDKHKESSIKLNDSIYVNRYKGKDATVTLVKYNNGNLIEIINKVNDHFFGDRLYFTNNKLTGYDFMKNDSESCFYFKFTENNRLINEYNTPVGYINLGLNQSKDSFEINMYFCSVGFKEMNVYCGVKDANLEKIGLKYQHTKGLQNNLYGRYVFLLPSRNINGSNPIINFSCKMSCVTIYGEKKEYNYPYTFELQNKYLE